MSRQLQGQVVVVTGAAEGIGYQIADQFLKRGVKTLFLLDINDLKGNESKKKLNEQYGEKAIFIKCDVTKDLEKVFREITANVTVGILINNAGVCDENSVRKTLEINAISVIEWSMKFWEHMRKDKGGKGGTILNVASLYGYYVDPYLPFYKASKYAVMGFTKTLGHEENFNRFGVRLIVLCPGFTTTNLTDQLKIDTPLLKEEFFEYMKTMKWQNAEVVGKAAVEAFEKGESGTGWKIEGGEPIEKTP